MNTLIIDTSSRHEIISIKANNKIYDMSEEVELSHSTTFFSNLQKCLDKIKISMNDIELIGVGIGPGSFTGVRISVTTARMIAQLLKIPLIGLKTQLLYATSVKCENNENILIAFDAKKNRVFGALYKKQSNEDQLTEIIQPGDYEIEHILDKIDNANTHAFGDGIEKYLMKIQTSVKHFNYIKKFTFDGTKASQLLEKLYHSKKKDYLDVNNVIPFYARKSDAEVMKEKRREKND